MSGVLEQILASKRAEIALLRTMSSTCEVTRQTLDVASALHRADALTLIAEVKFRSPSAGVLSRTMDAGTRALAYARGGAAMVSVLCDGPFFGGSFDDVTRARAALDDAGLAVPILAKEFIVDQVQLVRVREAGADAALIIARLLPGAALGHLVEACFACSLEPFVEVTSQAELERAMETRARVIGVNARDIDALVIDSVAARSVLEKIPARCVAVHLSGMKTVGDIEVCARGRADAVLVGEVLMQLDDPSDLLKRMLACTGK